MSKEKGSEFWILPVRVVPNASKSEIVGWEEQELKIKLNAVPEDGKANRELIKFLSRLSQFSKGKLSLQSGLKSRHKKIQIMGPNRDEFFAKIGIDGPN